MITNKYNNIRVEYDGIKFSSKRECARYKQLKLMETSGVIGDLKLQPSFKLKAKIISRGFPNGREITYRADFSYVITETDEYIVEDVKGMETKEFKIKKAFVFFFYGIDIKLVK